MVPAQLLLASVPGPAWVGEPPYENDYLGTSAVEQPVLQCWQEKGLVVNPTWSQDSGSVAYGVGLRKVKLTPATFRARAGATLRFALAGPAKLTLTVARAGGKKVKGTIRSAGKPGANTLRFKGRIGGHTLRPGRYHLTITARAMAGGASAKATMAFRIVR